MKIVAILSLYQGESNIRALRGCHDNYHISLASKQHKFILTVLDAKSLKPLVSAEWQALQDRIGNSFPPNLFLIVWFPLTCVWVTPVFTPIFTWQFSCLSGSSSIFYKDLMFKSLLYKIWLKTVSWWSILKALSENNFPCASSKTLILSIFWWKATIHPTRVCEWFLFLYKLMALHLEGYTTFKVCPALRCRVTKLGSALNWSRISYLVILAFRAH